MWWTISRKLFFKLYLIFQSPATRRALTLTCLKLGVQSLHSIEKLLYHEQAFVAVEAIFILAHLKHQRAYELLSQSINHTKPQIRLAVLEVSHKHPVLNKSNIAIKLLDDTSTRIQVAAARKIATIQDSNLIFELEKQNSNPQLRPASS